jgi:hypothetical protein
MSQTSFENEIMYLLRRVWQSGPSGRAPARPSAAKTKKKRQDKYLLKVSIVEPGHGKHSINCEGNLCHYS